MDNTKPKTVFKVVADRMIDNQQKYLSVAFFFWEGDRDRSSWSKTSPVILEYEIGKVTKPKIVGSAIYAFDCAQNALRFIRVSVGNADKHPILECEYEPSNVPLITEGKISPTLIPIFWRKLKGISEKDANKVFSALFFSNSDIVPHSAPSGTIMCKWVKPIGLA